MADFGWRVNCIKCFTCVLQLFFSFFFFNFSLEGGGSAAQQPLLWVHAFPYVSSTGEFYGPDAPPFPVLVMVMTFNCVHREMCREPTVLSQVIRNPWLLKLNGQSRNLVITILPKIFWVWSRLDNKYTSQDLYISYTTLYSRSPTLMKLNCQNICQRCQTFWTRTMF